MLNRARTAWGERKIAGALLMDVKSAFNNVARGHLVRLLESMGIEPDICRWVESFMTDRNVRIVIDGTEGQDRAVETGVPHPFRGIHLRGLRGGGTEDGSRRAHFVDDVAGWPPVKMLRK